MDRIEITMEGQTGSNAFLLNDWLKGPDNLSTSIEYKVSSHQGPGEKGDSGSLCGGEGAPILPAFIVFPPAIALSIPLHSPSPPSTLLLTDPQ